MAIWWDSKNICILTKCIQKAFNLYVWISLMAQFWHIRIFAFKYVFSESTILNLTFKGMKCQSLQVLIYKNLFNVIFKFVMLWCFDENDVLLP